MDINHKIENQYKLASYIIDTKFLTTIKIAHYMFKCLRQIE